MGVIEREAIQTLAIVDVSDGYGVELRQRRKRQEYSPDEAEALGRDLIEAAASARRTQREDQVAWEHVGGGVFSAPVRPAHGFDAAPVCRECSEGKHGACTGIALVDTATFDNPGSVDELPCGCSRADHQVIGGAA